MISPSTQHNCITGLFKVAKAATIIYCNTELNEVQSDTMQIPTFNVVQWLLRPHKHATRELSEELSLKQIICIENTLQRKTKTPFHCTVICDTEHHLSICKCIHPSVVLPVKVCDLSLIFCFDHNSILKYTFDPAPAPFSCHMPLIQSEAIRATHSQAQILKSVVNDQSSGSV